MELDKKTKQEFFINVLDKPKYNSVEKEHKPSNLYLFKGCEKKSLEVLPLN